MLLASLFLKMATVNSHIYLPPGWGKPLYIIQGPIWRWEAHRHLEGGVYDKEKLTLMGNGGTRDWPAGGRENPLEFQIQNIAARHTLKLLFRGTGCLQASRSKQRSWPCTCLVGQLQSLHLTELELSAISSSARQYLLQHHSPFGLSLPFLVRCFS